MIPVWLTYCDLRQGGYGWAMYAHHPGGELYAEGPGCIDERADADACLWPEIMEQAIAAGIPVFELERRED